MAIFNSYVNVYQRVRQFLELKEIVSNQTWQLKIGNFMEKIIKLNGEFHEISKLSHVELPW